MVTSVFRFPQQLQIGRGNATPLPDRCMRQFVGGPENTLAKAAAEAMVSGCGMLRGPTLLYGPTGVGKSLLSRLLTEEFASQHPTATVVSTTATDYFRALSNAREVDGLNDLRTKHRTVDLFVLDDLQELAEKQLAQIELIHSIDERQNSNLATWVTSRFSLADLDSLLPGLKSRLAGGLTIPLIRPAAATRNAIVSQLADELCLELPAEALQMLVSPKQRHARRLESVAQLTNFMLELAVPSPGKVTPADLRRRLTEPPKGLRFTARQITTQTARHFQLKYSELTGPSRRKATVFARGVAIYLVRQLTGESLEEIGRHFGSRDHSTILHSYRKTEKAKECDPVVTKSIREIADGLGALSLLG